MSKAAVAKKVQGSAVARPPGDDLTVGQELTLREGIEILEREERYDLEVVNIQEQIPGVLFDAALAVHKAMVQTFKWVFGEKNIEGAPMYTIPSGVGKTTTVPVGSFTVKGIEGTLSTYPGADNRGRVVLIFSAKVRRKDEQKIREIAALAREILKKESLYRGKAIRVRFTDDDGEDIQMVIPEFIDVSKATVESLILNDEVMAAVETAVFVPILYPEACDANGIRTKQGTLLEGIFGTGKTTIAYVTANLCEQMGETFVMLERADEIEQGLRLAETIGGKVQLFCEDVDRVLSGERNVSIDAIFNTIDGIDTKQSKVRIILTTNDAEAIQQGMMRPGRFDDVITLPPPDAKTVERLIRYYAGEKLEPGTDLTSTGKALAGQIPAVIMSCVEKATKSQIKLDKGKTKGQLKITGEAMVDASFRMQRQLGLLNRESTGMNGYEALGRLHAQVAEGLGENTVVNFEKKSAKKTARG